MAKISSVISTTSAAKTLTQTKVIAIVGAKNITNIIFTPALDASKYSYVFSAETGELTISLLSVPSTSQKKVTSSWSPLKTQTTEGIKGTGTLRCEYMDGTKTSLSWTAGASCPTNHYTYSTQYAFDYSVSVEYSTNVSPAVNLSVPTDASTLYENSTLPIVGNATDADKDNIVNIRYSINDGTARALATGISDGNTAIPFAKTLTFKNSKLYDGTTAITDSLAEGTAHMVRVWATDDAGATSAIISRSFYAVPNRAPSLTIDTPQPTGTIGSDKFTISGTASDIDGNDVVVTYRINSGLAKEIYRGQGAPFSFDVTLKELAVGTNDIVIEVSDTYAFKASKTVRIRKNEVKTEQLKSVARYTITPPKGSATGVVVWVQRDTGLKVDAKMSMVLEGEQEQYVEPDNPDKKTRVVSDTDVEDQFTFSSDVAKTHLTLMLELERASLEASDSIKLITGVLE